MSGRHLLTGTGPSLGLVTITEDNPIIHLVYLIPGCPVSGPLTFLGSHFIQIYGYISQGFKGMVTNTWYPVTQLHLTETCPQNRPFEADIVPGCLPNLCSWSCNHFKRALCQLRTFKFCRSLSHNMFTELTLPYLRS